MKTLCFERQKCSSRSSKNLICIAVFLLCGEGCLALLLLKVTRIMHFLCWGSNWTVCFWWQRQCLGLLSRFGGSDRLRQFKLQDDNAEGDRVNKRDEIELAMQQVRTKEVARTFSLKLWNFTCCAGYFCCRTFMWFWLVLMLCAVCSLV